MTSTPNHMIGILLGFLILTLSSVVSADTVVLKDGRVFQGMFKGGTETTISFETEDGIEELSIGNITSLTFSPREKQPAETTATGAGEAAKVAGGVVAVESATDAGDAPAGPVTVPAGTNIMIKLDKAVSTASHSEGSAVTAVLEVPIKVGDVIAVPKGAQIYGKVVESRGGRRIGTQKIVMQFTDILINDQLTPIATDPIGAEGGRGAAAKQVGAGALIGAAAGDAGTGALVGAGVALLAGGRHIEIPAGTIAEIPLKGDLTVNN